MDTCTSVGEVAAVETMDFLAGKSFVVSGEAKLPVGTARQDCRLSALTWNLSITEISLFVSEAGLPTRVFSNLAHANSVTTKQDW
jgi:hypothetical protein